MLRVTVGVTATSNDQVYPYPGLTPQRFDVAQTTQGGGGPGEVTVGTTEETISFGDIAPGLIVLENTDATNFVEWGFSTGVRPGRLYPRTGDATSKACRTEIQVASGTTIYIKADTASCKVLVLGYNL